MRKRNDNFVLMSLWVCVCALNSSSCVHRSMLVLFPFRFLNNSNYWLHINNVFLILHSLFLILSFCSLFLFLWIPRPKSLPNTNSVNFSQKTQKCSSRRIIFKLTSFVESKISWIADCNKIRRHLVAFWIFLGVDLIHNGWQIQQ